jgi:hypothetical protein
MKVRASWVIGLPLAVLLFGCGSAPDPSDGTPSTAPGTAEPTEDGAVDRPASASGQADGVIVTLSVSSDRLAPGDRISIRVDVLNAALGPVTWMSGGCGLLNDLAITGPALAEQPPGDPGPDAAGLARWSALSQGQGIASWRPPGLPEDVMVGCPANLAYEDIGPGETATAEATWRAVDAFGAPAPAGDYMIEAAFPYIGRMAADEMQGEPPPMRPIPVSLPLMVEGPAFDGIPASAAIDAATADRRVAAWFGQLPANQMTGAHIRLVDGVWQYTIDVGLDGATTVVRVDPATGEVLDVRLAGGG